jgi:hypothetical protein
MTRRLESVEGVTGLEIGVASESSGETVETFIQAASGELAVIIRLPMEQSAELAAKAIHLGAAAISLAPPRGELPSEGGEIIQGRLYGPAVLPMTLRLLCIILAGYSTIAAGGITTDGQDAMWQERAVQLNSIFWRMAGYNVLA